jgi:low affinity Fe/Cu permease
LTQQAGLCDTVRITPSGRHEPAGIVSTEADDTIALVTDEGGSARPDERPRWRRGLISAEKAGASERPPGRRWSSLMLHRMNEATAHSTAGLVAAALILGWVVFGFIIGFPNWWDNTLFIVSSTVTLVLVFAIQHTQARQQTATQRKLDELLRAIPRADNRLIAVEEAPDQELEALASEDLAIRIDALDDLGPKD